MKSTAELLAAHLRKTLGQEGHGRPSSDPATPKDMVRKFLTKKSKAEARDVDLASLAGANDGDTASLSRKLARAKMALLEKSPENEGHGLADLMAD